MRKQILVGLAALMPVVAQAHTGHELSGFMAGVLHPLSGLDHLLAFICAGVLLAGRNRQQAMTGAGAFAVALLLGATVGLAGWVVPQVEQWVLLSVMLMGLAVVLVQRLKSSQLIAMVGSVLLMHGWVHGLEMPLAASPAVYLSGFIAASLMLVGCGLALVKFAPRSLVQGMGALVAGAGLLMTLA